MLNVLCVTFSNGTNGDSQSTRRGSSVGDCIIDRIVHWLRTGRHCLDYYYDNVVDSTYLLRYVRRRCWWVKPLDILPWVIGHNLGKTWVKGKTG